MADMLVSVMLSYEKHWVVGCCLIELLHIGLTCRTVDVQSLFTQMCKWLLSNTL